MLDLPVNVFGPRRISPEVPLSATISPLGAMDGPQRYHPVIPSGGTASWRRIDARTHPDRHGAEARPEGARTDLHRGGACAWPEPADRQASVFQRRLLTRARRADL